MRKKLFGKEIDPACGYCDFSAEMAEKGFLVCKKRGIVEESHSCRKFKYNPLKRKPLPEVKLQQFEKSEFEL